MADKTFMFIVTAGTMAGLAILLLVSRGRRRRAIKTTDKEHALSPSSSPQENEPSSSPQENEPSSSPQENEPSSSPQENEKNKKGKQTKKYTSDGKLIYEEQ
jgi:glucan-binding YG repeat protein